MPPARVLLHLPLRQLDRRPLSLCLRHVVAQASSARSACGQYTTEAAEAAARRCSALHRKRQSSNLMRPVGVGVGVGVAEAERAVHVLAMVDLRPAAQSLLTLL